MDKPIRNKEKQKILSQYMLLRFTFLFMDGELCHRNQFLFQKPLPFQETK